MVKNPEYEECARCAERIESAEEVFCGFRFSDWVLEMGMEPKDIDAVGATLGRVFRFWREGRAVSLRQADELLTALGLHLSDVPDELRRPPPLKQSQEHSPEIREKVFTLFKEGMEPVDIARHLSPLGPTTSTIRSWLSKGGLVRRRVFQTVWDGVEKKGPDECWPWQGAVRHKSSRGTPLHHPTWRGTRVHRVILKEEFGIDDPRVAILITCKNLRCCNPAHFEVKQQGSWQKFKIWGANHDGRK